MSTQCWKRAGGTPCPSSMTGLRSNLLAANKKSCLPLKSLLAASAPLMLLEPMWTYGDNLADRLQNLSGSRSAEASMHCITSFECRLSNVLCDRESEESKKDGISFPGRILYENWEKFTTDGVRSFFVPRRELRARGQCVGVSPLPLLLYLAYLFSDPVVHLQNLRFGFLVKPNLIFR